MITYKQTQTIIKQVVDHKSQLINELVQMHKTKEYVGSEQIIKEINTRDRQQTELCDLLDVIISILYSYQDQVDEIKWLKKELKIAENEIDELKKNQPIEENKTDTVSNNGFYKLKAFGDPVTFTPTVTIERELLTEDYPQIYGWVENTIQRDIP